MPSLRFLAGRLADRVLGTEFERVMERVSKDSHRRFLFFWNRGLGDIPIGLVPLFLRIRESIEGSVIEVITRDELREPFRMTDVGAIHVLPGLVREARIDLEEASRSLGLDLSTFAATFDYPDPRRWLERSAAEFPPRLSWPAEWDALADQEDSIARDRLVIGAHVSSETAGYYGYVKDWPAEAWRSLFARFPQACTWVLFGNSAAETFAGPNIVDLRGKTTFPMLMSLVRHRCRVLIAPDSGILTMAYYIDADFPLHLISLWSDPRQGVLWQGSPSPNRELRHVPLQGGEEDVRRIPVEAVARALEDVIRPHL
jgi:hypothetical protein